MRRRGRFPWRERGLRFNNPNVGMSSHNYATDHLDLPAQNAQRQSRRALLMSVFGATTDPTHRRTRCTCIPRCTTQMGRATARLK